MSPTDGWKWSEMSIIWCISATNNVKSCNIQRNRSNGQFLWAWMIQFFGENSFLAHFDQMNTPKCYTWLESYGSHLFLIKLFVSPCEASDFWWHSGTDFLHDLRLRHKKLRWQLIWGSLPIAFLPSSLPSIGDPPCKGLMACIVPPIGLIARHLIAFFPD